jgi:hypothetical protein
MLRGSTSQGREIFRSCYKLGIDEEGHNIVDVRTFFKSTDKVKITLYIKQSRPLVYSLPLYLPVTYNISN